MTTGLSPASKALLSDCTLCPRNCRVNRLAGELGFCGAGVRPRVALVCLHPWEEPCLAGDKGAGTVFFSHCSLRCVFCQNHAISHSRGPAAKGCEVSIGRLAEIFLEQEARGAATLDLVSPTHYLPQIVDALRIAKAHGLSLPVVWNSSGYDAPAALGRLRGLVDIFLPDVKYLDPVSAKRYSSAEDYPSHILPVLEAMLALVGDPQFSSDGRMKKGVLVRHLILPGRRHESMAILDTLHERFGDRVYLSLMNQYTPLYRASSHREINRPLTTFEYESVLDHARGLGITRCYVQEGGTVSDSFVPIFDGQGVKKRNRERERE
ncbi:radical SAM protein [Selenomonas sp. TAMA-11512]|uniref:radical SAM protein n=1 Tax=Selenomonas sp. TAMA-11512 TaxID=3095337 RepID=UPI0030931039|nr:radical SAM protein [Selenomonas sp. TAMA-11512]